MPVVSVPFPSVLSDLKGTVLWKHGEKVNWLTRSVVWSSFLVIQQFWSWSRFLKKKEDKAWKTGMWSTDRDLFKQREYKSTLKENWDCKWRKIRRWRQCKVLCVSVSETITLSLPDSAVSCPNLSALNKGWYTQTHVAFIFIYSFIHSFIYFYAKSTGASSGKHDHHKQKNVVLFRVFFFSKTLIYLNR